MSSPRLLDTVIVGYGHAGRDLHLPTMRRLRKMRGARRAIGAVDPTAYPSGARDVIVRRNHKLLRALYSPDHTVVHVCTPPHVHADTIEEYGAAGYQRFVVEKPLVPSRADLMRVQTACERDNLNVLVVTNWLFSRLTDAILGHIHSRRDVPVQNIELRSTKSRIRKSLHSDVHMSAFEVEMPHLVALAVRLCGPNMNVVGARSSDLVIGDRTVHMMASADILLEAPEGYPLHLSTDLVSPFRERSIRIEWSDGQRLAGFYPVDSEDLYSYLECRDADGVTEGHYALEDDTLLSFFSQAYRHFETGAVAPDSGIPFHGKVSELLIAAGDHCVSTAGPSAEDLLEAV